MPRDTLHHYYVGEGEIMIKILIADDHDVVRSGLRRILEARSNWVVVAEACDGQQAISMALKTAPDVAMLDYYMPRVDGIEATRQVRAQLPRTEVLIFTMHHSRLLIEDMQRSGAAGYLLKSDASRHLLKAIETLAAHKTYFRATETDEFDAELGRSSVSEGSLTPREHYVLRLIAEGLTNKAVAHALEISPKTVETHRASIMRKLGLPSTASLVRYAVRNGYVEA
jgi:DNA-binding NarL/FixJ family response regulator